MHSEINGFHLKGGSQDVECTFISETIYKSNLMHENNWVDKPHHMHFTHQQTRLPENKRYKPTLYSWQEMGAFSKQSKGNLWFECQSKQKQKHQKHRFKFEE